MLLVALALTALAAPLPPNIPEHFITEFTEYTAFNASEASPPYANGLPPPPFYASRGLTYYDWALKAMIE